MVTWKEIIGYEGRYEASDDGQIRGLTRSVKHNYGGLKIVRGVVIKHGFTTQGYASLDLCKEGKATTRLVHRIIAETFIPNPANLPQINHINGIKTDNRVANLEWVSVSGNQLHSYRMGLSKSGRLHHFSTPVINNRTGQIYDTINDAAISIGMNRGTLYCKLKGKRRNDTDLQILKTA